MIVFFGDYPNKNNQHEGMAQRILAIDEQLAGDQRIYLFVSHRRYLKKEVIRVKPGVIQYHCNLFLHVFFILRLLRRAHTLYFHSVIHVLPVLPLVPFFPASAAIMLDLHGLPSEELALSGYPFKSRLYGLSERIIIRKADTVIAVTRAMVTHFKQKYPHVRTNYQVFSIIPSHLPQPLLFQPPADPAGIVNVLYSGNTQSWQNIELMMELIRNNQSPNIRYYLLTGEPEVMQRHLEKAGLGGQPAIIVKTVSPDSLKEYYEKAHYGFILRDDIPVNRVACPTKLIEYLYYGIIPVVKSPDIGDFRELGYEYLPFTKFSVNIQAHKSVKNQEIAQQILTGSPVPVSAIIRSYG